MIVKNDGIGDLIVASGVIAHIARLSPEPVDLLTCRENADIAKVIPGLRQVLICSRNALRLHQGATAGSNEEADRALLSALANNTYSKAIVLRRFITESTLALMTAIKADEKYCMWQIPTNISRKTAEEISAPWTRIGASIRIRSEIDYFAAVVERIFGKKIDGRPNLRLPGEGEDFTEDGSIVLALGGNSSRWPILNWVSTARHLQKRQHTPLHLFGGKKYELLTALAISATTPKSINHVGRMKLLDSLPYIRRASLVIANDTGFAHLAALVARRIMILQGGGTFARFFPWPGAMNQYVLYRGMPCFDCDWRCRYDRPREKRACLTHITAEDVVSYAGDILAGTAPCIRNVGQKTGDYRLAWRYLPPPQEHISLSAETLAVERRGPFIPY